MAHWTNLQRIEIFVNLGQLYITSEGGLCLVEPGLTAGSPADEIWARLEI